MSIVMSIEELGVALFRTLDFLCHISEVSLQRYDVTSCAEEGSTVRYSVTVNDGVGEYLIEITFRKSSGEWVPTWAAVGDRDWFFEDGIIAGNDQALFEDIGELERIAVYTLRQFAQGAGTFIPRPLDLYLDRSISVIPFGGGTGIHKVTAFVAGHEFVIFLTAIDLEPHEIMAFGQRRFTWTGTAWVGE